MDFLTGLCLLSKTLPPLPDPLKKRMTMQKGLISVPAFADGRPVYHFFGTRHQSGRLTPPTASSRRANDVRIISVKQVHGTDCLVIDRPVQAGAGFSGTWDALVTDQAAVLLTVRTADCVPVLVHDPSHGVVAAVHAGWRGAVDGIVPKTLATMAAEFGTALESVRMVIGPSAGDCCYEVDGAVLAPLKKRYPYASLVIRETGRNRAVLNLRDLVRRQAQAAGVHHERIWAVNVCTICHPHLFYSYRRDGTVIGTMTSGIMLQPDRLGLAPALRHSRDRVQRRPH
jgi:polyphenol oxidase